MDVRNEIADGAVQGDVEIACLKKTPFLRRRMKLGRLLFLISEDIVLYLRHSTVMNTRLCSLSFIDIIYNHSRDDHLLSRFFLGRMEESKESLKRIFLSILIKIFHKKLFSRI